MSLPAVILGATAGKVRHDHDLGLDDEFLSGDKRRRDGWLVPPELPRRPDARRSASGPGRHMAGPDT